jgi:flagellar hook-associated protein 1 FlgK
MTITSNALSGALAAQGALNSVSQNIANAQTKGYTRQGVLLVAMNPDPNTKSAGNGVQISSLLRFSDSYKLQQMWRAASELGAHTESQRYLTQMETVMSDPKSSISYGLDNFFSALNAAAVDPTSTPLRQAVITSADSMSQQFNSIYNVTANQLISLRQQQTTILPSINQAAADIAQLNQLIVQTSGGGGNTSALIDKRDQLIDGIASQVAVEVLDNPNGSVTVSLKSGQPLVAANLAAKLSYDTVDGVSTLTGTFAGSSFSLDDTQVGGQLGGLADYRKNTLLPLQQSIMDMAQQLAEKINTQLGAGFKNGTDLGTDLLKFNPTSATGLLQVTSGFQASDLAFSADGTPGDSGNLQKLVDIKGQPIEVTSLGTVLLGDADTQLVGKLGIDSQQNQSQLRTATTIRNQSEDDWKSTSAVNTDEEGINLIEFNQMYQANMKVISVANTLFDSTLQMFG